MTAITDYGEQHFDSATSKYTASIPTTILDSYNCEIYLHMCQSYLHKSIFLKLLFSRVQSMNMTWGKFMLNVHNILSLA